MTDPMQRTVALVQQAKAGHRAAVDELLTRYQPRLRSIVRARLRGDARRLCDSQDVMQEVLLKAATNLEEFAMRDEASFLHWLGTVAANHIRDLADQAHAARRDVRREASPRARPGDSTHVLEIMGSAATPSQEAARAELAQIVDECVHGLPEPQRELILMRSYAGMDWKSIGDRLGIAEDAARMRHATAKVALARLLAARGIAPPQ